MKPRRLSEVRALLAQPDFQSWWAALEQERKAQALARQQYDDLLSQTTLMEFRAEQTQKSAIDTLNRAGELEELAANLAVGAQELENRSLLVVADFEEQRFLASELWYRLGAAEKTLDEKREALQRGNNRKAELELKAAEKAHRHAADEYGRETARKDQLWEEVEGIWERQVETSLLGGEQRIRGRRTRSDAEQLFARAEERKQRAVALRAEAEAANQTVEAHERELQRLAEAAREQFGCTAGLQFLYFSVKENPKLAWAVALVDDQESFNVEVKPLAVYSVDRQRGVSFLAPARIEPPSVEEGDRRFEEYFLCGRKGEVRTAGA